MPAQHASTNRGTRSLDLLLIDIDNEDISVPGEVPIDVDLTFNATVIPNGKDTRYWWKTFEWPTTDKVHLIGFEPIIPAGEEAAVHHILLYMCGHEFSEFEKTFVGENSDSMIPDTLRACNFIEPLAGWAGMQSVCLSVMMMFMCIFFLQLAVVRCAFQRNSVCQSATVATVC